ncbi:hypothetical protein [Caloranaerobacter sp. DY30410]|uniref:hypothetical protein n=1 Tax=Caloranaerobacter sp. DY30410 TaxID=3238305 RepID=UPI003D064B2B
MNKNKLFLITILVSILLYGCSQKTKISAIYPIYDLDTTIQNSDIIVKGEIAEKIKEYMIGEHKDIPLTDYVFVVTKYYKIPKDMIKAKELIVTQDGNEKMIIDNHPLMQKGKKYILFLRKSKNGKLVMVGGVNGKYCINNGKVYNMVKPKELKDIYQFEKELKEKIKP